MTPTPTPAHISNNMLRLAHRRGDFGNVPVRHVEGHDFSSDGFGEAVVMKRFPFGHLPSVPTGIIYGWLGFSSSRNHVLDIVFLCSPSEMLRIAAGRVIAGMKSMVPPLIRFSMTDKTRKTRRWNLLRANREASIAVNSCGLPLPTFVITSDSHFTPKAGEVFFAVIDHDNFSFAGVISQIGRIGKW